jgi:hypothetical protein
VSKGLSAEFEILSFHSYGCYEPWLRIAYVKICERSGSLTEHEAEKVGARKTALLARARETVRNPHHFIPSRPPSPQATKADLSFGTPVPLELPTNEFYHDRYRVDYIVSEVFFPSEKKTMEMHPIVAAVHIRKKSLGRGSSRRSATDYRREVCGTSAHLFIEDGNPGVRDALDKRWAAERAEISCTALELHRWPVRPIFDFLSAVRSISV